LSESSQENLAKASGFFGAPAIGVLIEKVTGSQALAFGIGGLGWILLGVYMINEGADDVGIILGILIGLAGIAAIILGGYYFTAGE
jgi:hypothetical protein